MAQSEHIEMSPGPSGELPGRYVGALRRMGANGPVYEVLGVIDRETIEIRVVGSDERAPYPVACFLADPED